MMYNSICCGRNSAHAVPYHKQNSSKHYGSDWTASIGFDLGQKLDCACVQWRFSFDVHAHEKPTVYMIEFI